MNQSVVTSHAFTGVNMAQNGLAARSPLRTPLGELTAIPQTF